MMRGAPLQGARLVQDIADKYQRCTQTYVRRPYGVGLLVACCDATGPHLYETCPSGNFSEFVAVAIGARAQSAKTYLEKHHKTFKDTPVEELCTHALQALAGCVAGDKELDAAAASLASGHGGRPVSFDRRQRRAETRLDLVEVEKTAAQTEGMELEGASS